MVNFKQFVKDKMIRRSPKAKARWDSKGYILAERQRIIFLIEKKRIVKNNLTAEEIIHNQTVDEILYSVKGHERTTPNEANRI